MKIRKKDKPVVVDRVIPQADLSNFKTPDIAKVKTLPKSDMDLVKSLSEELRVTGVIDRESDEPATRQTLQELGEIFTEAESHQKYEKDINPHQYDEESNAILEEREYTEGDLFDNPSLDGIDDYGTQVYDRYIDLEGEEVTPHTGEINSQNIKNSGENASKGAAFRLPDGTIIYGELL